MWKKITHIKISGDLIDLGKERIEREHSSPSSDPIQDVLESLHDGTWIRQMREGLTGPDAAAKERERMDPLRGNRVEVNPETRELETGGAFQGLPAGTREEAMDRHPAGSALGDSALDGSGKGLESEDVLPDNVISLDEFRNRKGKLMEDISKKRVMSNEFNERIASESAGIWYDEDDFEFIKEAQDETGLDALDWPWQWGGFFKPKTVAVPSPVVTPDKNVTPSVPSASPSSSPSASPSSSPSSSPTPSIADQVQENNDALNEIMRETGGGGSGYEAGKIKKDKKDNKDDKNKPIRPTRQQKTRARQEKREVRKEKIHQREVQRARSNDKGGHKGKGKQSSFDESLDVLDGTLGYYKFAGNNIEESPELRDQWEGSSEGANWEAENWALENAQEHGLPEDLSGVLNLGVTPGAPPTSTTTNPYQLTLGVEPEDPYNGIPLCPDSTRFGGPCEGGIDTSKERTACSTCRGTGLHPQYLESLESQDIPPHPSAQ